MFITPMAAVAGAVADEVLAAMRSGAALWRAYVNNGGDIALWLAPGEQFDVAIAGLDGQGKGLVTLREGDEIGGVATSGRGGRSLSCGIADSVTVLAGSSAVADAAATLIANAVDLPGHPRITRVPAREVDPDSDLGDRLVVTGCARLTRDEAARALGRGVDAARAMQANGLISAAFLALQNETAMLAARPERLCHA